MQLVDTNHDPVAACDKNSTRIVLEYVNIVRLGEDAKRKHNGLAVSADGFILSALPVILEDDDVPGLVHRSVFERMPKHLRAFTMSLLAEQVKFLDGWLAPRRAHPNDTYGELKYPDFDKVVPRKPEQDQYPLVGLDQKLVQRACKALGTARIVMRTYGQSKAVVILPQSHAQQQFEPVAPYALVMPMHIANASQHVPALRPYKPRKTQSKGDTKAA